MKKILFTGDSITKGDLGCGFVHLIARDFPEYQLCNIGRNGDTVTRIMNRTLDHVGL